MGAEPALETGRLKNTCVNLRNELLRCPCGRQFGDLGLLEILEKMQRIDAKRASADDVEDGKPLA